MLDAYVRGTSLSDGSVHRGAQTPLPIDAYKECVVSATAQSESKHEVLFELVPAS